MLEGIKIISFTHYIQGPCAVQYLADLGADVIKIEPLSGAFERRFALNDLFIQGESIFFILGNRNQDSFAVDLKCMEGKKIIHSLIGDCDVLVENFRPGAMDKLGFGYDEVKKINPGIIYCSLSGYGNVGAYREKAGQDVLIQSFSGIATHLSKRPKTIGIHIIDQHGAALGAMGILAALFNRSSTGKGHKIDASLLAAALDIQQEALAYHFNGTESWNYSDSGVGAGMQFAPDGIYETADGYIAVTLIPNEVLRKLSDSLSSFSQEDQANNQNEVDEVFSKVMKERTTKEWKVIFDSFGVWYESVNDYQDMLNDKNIKQNINIIEFPLEKQSIRLIGHPNKYDGKFPSLRKVPPALGNIEYELLHTIGYSDDSINELKEKRVIIGGAKSGEDFIEEKI